ncbi:MAG: M48 family metallopeptidase [Bacteroidales bacterium]|nr:M48 family metallopeptidase [Bacteroidales bacterium]
MVTAFLHTEYIIFFRSLWTHHLGCEYNAPFYLIISIIIFNFILERGMSYLNSRHFGRKLPEEVNDVYDEEEYLKSQKYKKVNERFSLLTSTVSFTFLMLILFYHVFGYFDQLARGMTTNPILIALMFFGFIMLASDIINTPFALYDTFVIEERFGFNTTSFVTFWLDKIKNWILVGIVGGGVTALVIWIYYIFRDHNRFDQFWIWAWAGVTVIMILMNVFYSTLIVPIFNKQTPLEDGELRDAISDFCRKVGFDIENVYVIDGSKRSTKANAYFTGFGSRKRIVLYDTLIEDLSTEEIVAVLSHEIGHYKKKHTLINIPLGVIQTGITLYVFSLFTLNPMLSWALGAKVHSIHMVILAFGIIYSPISTLVGLALNKLSRNHEFQADNYVKQHYDATHLITALKKLSSRSLTNLTPHPAYVFFYYSHPTLIQRIRALNKKE